MARIEVKSDVGERVWKIEVPVGAAVGPDEPVMIVE